MKKLFWILLLSVPLAAQIPVPQLNLTGNIGCQGFPCVNSGTLVLASDSNHTMTAQESSAFYIKVTSTVSLTATRNLISPSGRFPFTIENATTGGQSIQIIGASGTGVTIPNGYTYAVWNDGTNYVQIGSQFTYPGAGIPNSTGSAWGTSYGTSGSGSVALTGSPTFTGTVSFATLSQPATSSQWNSTGLFLSGAFQWYPPSSANNYIFSGSPTTSRSISFPDASGTIALRGGTCTMVATTTCTSSVAYGADCVATVQGTSPIASACSISGTTLTVTAATANEYTWAWSIVN